ncbi:hypothetical protein TNCV_4562461 [Trichonephila clavipes]|nr:hypothetical protein TNCV_4562461 [Trichonephila clavipes]
MSANIAVACYELQVTESWRSFGDTITKYLATGKPEENSFCSNPISKLKTKCDCFYSGGSKVHLVPAFHLRVGKDQND